MIWICRAGVNSIYLDYFLESENIYIPWEGFRKNLAEYDSRDALKKLVVDEKGDAPRTSISNWAGQLYAFCYLMSKDDYVLIPHKGSRSYTFAKITGDYMYDENNKMQLWHSRSIEIILSAIPREAFSQSIQYSLGAYRTIFKAKDENEILTVVRSISDNV